MRALLQRVKSGSVSVENKIIGEINQGLVVLLGVNESDTEKEAEYLAEKIIGLRIFQDDDGKMNQSVMDKKGEILAISQFTLFADTTRGRRPGFSQAARPEKSLPLYNYFIDQLKNSDLKIEQGEFGAEMLVNIQNDGPVTILIDSDDKFSK